MVSLNRHFYRFGEFTLDIEQRVLQRAGRPLHLTPKVFETLLILVEHSGQIVSKETLMSRLWPTTFVEEANLAFNIQQLRKSLGDNARRPHYIETVARRGYRFIADVEALADEERAAAPQPSPRPATLDARPADAGPTRTPEALRAEPASEVVEPSPTAPAGKRFAGLQAAAQATTTARKRSVAMAVAVLIVLLTGAAVFLLKLPGSTDRVLSGDQRVGGKGPAASLFKLKKLTETGQSRHVAISPDGRYVAYTRLLKGQSSVWLRQLATNTNLEIIPPTGDILGLAFANTGEHLYFVRRGEPTAGPLAFQTALYRIPVLGGAPVKIVENLEGNFSISADDRQIAFICQGINRDGQRQYSLMAVNSDGSAKRTVFVGTHPDDLDTPVWSPDGRSIICARGSSDGGGQRVGLIEVTVNEGTKRDLSPEPFFHITKIAWLPDHSALILSARKDLGSNNQLWRLSYPGLQISQVTEDLIDYLDLSVASEADKAVASQAVRISDIWVGPGRGPQELKKVTQALTAFCWTPDGRLVYTSMASGNIDLWVMQPDGTQQRQLTNHPAVDDAPVVTPDDRHIVFLSDRNGSLQIWRMNIDGSNQIQLTDGAGKAHPALSPDGKWVFYNTTDDWHLWKVPIDGGAPTPLTQYFALRPAVSPDGTRLACISRTESRRELVILPFGGGLPLKRLDFAAWSSQLRWTADAKAVIYARERGGVTSLVKQSLDGGPPQELMSFGEDELYDFSYSFDGHSFAAVRGAWQHDIVLISALKSP